MNNTIDELAEKLYETQRLLESMVAELRFRGCEDNHRLIRQTHDLRNWLERLKLKD